MFLTNYYEINPDFTLRYTFKCDETLVGLLNSSNGVTRFSFILYFFNIPLLFTHNVNFDFGSPK